MKSPAVLYLVVPCYNEEAILADSASKLAARLRELVKKFGLAAASRVLFVDDGSSDATWAIIKGLIATDEIFCGLKLAANRGHQNALLAGLLKAREFADATISLDADLQDDIAVLDEFVSAYLGGDDVVYGVRSDRSSDSWFKRNSALAFYRVLELLGCRIVYNHADFRLMSRRALDALAEYREVNLFLRGLVPLIGFRHSNVYYRRLPCARETHYPLSKMLFLAWDGVTSFSIRPIRLITVLGFGMFAFSAVMLLVYLYAYWMKRTVPGWTSLVFVSLLLGGIQLFSLGVIGEYIGKIYMEVKHRPRFVTEEFCAAGCGPKTGNGDIHE